jgi:hypothetical protein
MRLRGFSRSEHRSKRHIYSFLFRLDLLTDHEPDEIAGRAVLCPPRVRIRLTARTE